MINSLVFDLNAYVIHFKDGKDVFMTHKQLAFSGKEMSPQKITKEY